MPIFSLFGVNMTVIPFIYHDEDDLMSNTYLIIDNKKNCVVIDPSSPNDGLVNYIKKNELICKAVLLTHAHFDHMRGVDKIVQEFSRPLYVGFDDMPGLYDMYLNCSELCGTEVALSSKGTPVSDNDILHLLDEDIKVIYTPYHTIGSVSYYLEKSSIIFTGDSLSNGCIGRSDLPTSNRKLIESSLAKLSRLPDDVKVYPGHGRFTSIREERMLNTFVKQ